MKEIILNYVKEHPRTCGAMAMVLIFCIGAMLAGATIGETLMMFSIAVAMLISMSEVD